ncbi:molybdenum ABC transporter ATP-binding protein [Bryobacterales bacterium F-183]|nr:molybdenum ABC transporter ATP-binding protein [Bryobacterales bacterium F-183]
MTTTAPLLEFRNVTVYRDAQKALDRVTLQINEGEHLAILGPNGSGKSTLIAALTRDVYPFLGDMDWTLKIMGRDRWHVFELRSMMGIVTNDLMLACRRDYTAREVVLSGFFSSIGIWPNHDVQPYMVEKANEVMELLEITHLADRPLCETSSGEGRRAVIGRALVSDPKALILDEPSTSLDLKAMRELRDIMSKVARTGKSLILVTHHVDEIIPEMDRVLFMNDGRVVQDGPKKDVLTAANLSELFGVPVELAERDGYYNCW